jgi:hypothetical protein
MPFVYPSAVLTQLKPHALLKASNSHNKLYFPSTNSLPSIKFPHFAKLQTSKVENFIWLSLHKARNNRRQVTWFFNFSIPLLLRKFD